MGAGDGARLGSRRQLRRGAAARAAPAAGSERARERERERGQRWRRRLLLGHPLGAVQLTRMAKTAAPTDGSSGKARRRGAAGRAGSLLLSPARLRAARPPSLPPSPLAAPARPPAPRSPFHLKIFKTLHINICALHNLTRALLIARSLMQPARPIAEGSPGGEPGGRRALRTALRQPRHRPSRLPSGRLVAGLCPWLGILYYLGSGWGCV